MWLSGWYSCFIFRRLQVSILTQRSAILTKFLRFPSRQMLTRYLKTGHNCFLPHSSSFSMVIPTFNATPQAAKSCGWRMVTIQSNNRKTEWFKLYILCPINIYYLHALSNSAYVHGFQLMFSAGPICKTAQHGHIYPLHKSNQ
jgi:hypothetical protein